MSSSNLDPPTIQSLSDDVIGNVVLRIVPTHQFPGYGKSVNNFLTSAAISRDRSLIREYSTSVNQSIILKTKSTPSPPSLHSTRIHPGVDAVEHKQQCTKENKLSGSFDHGKPVEGHCHVKDDDAIKEHRLKRIRLNQARYRKKLENRPKELENQIKQVTDQIEGLVSERKDLLSGISMQKNAWDAALMYVRIFRRGFRAPDGTHMGNLKSFIASDVIFSGGIGLHALLNNWRTFTTSFPSVCIELKNLKQITKDSVLATTTTSITVPQSSIQSAFPYLSDSNRGMIISAKLQDHNLILHGSIRFDWDNTIHRVVSIQTVTDTISPLFELLGSLEDVSHVLNGAHTLSNLVL